MALRRHHPEQCSAVGVIAFVRNNDQLFTAFKMECIVRAEPLRRAKPHCERVLQFEKHDHVRLRWSRTPLSPEQRCTSLEAFVTHRIIGGTMAVVSGSE
jgi:hypothetical protein